MVGVGEQGVITRRLLVELELGIMETGLGLELPKLLLCCPQPHGAELG